MTTRRQYMAHPISPVPSNLHRGPLAHRPEPIRTDPGYWPPEPLDWHELAYPWLWIAAVVCVVAFVGVMALFVAVVPGPAA